MTNASIHSYAAHGLTALFAAATQEASAAMSRWTNGLISLALDEVREIPLECVCTELGLGAEPSTMVVLPMTGAAGGDMILAFDEADGRRLAAVLLNRPVATAPQWTELERSALCETGNILSCAYLNALTRALDVELVPAPPHFTHDYVAGVLEQALMLQAADCDTVQICRTRFRREGTELSWHVFFVPNAAMRERMRQVVDVGDAGGR